MGLSVKYTVVISGFAYNCVSALLLMDTLLWHEDKAEACRHAGSTSRLIWLERPVFTSLTFSSLPLFLFLLF